MLRTLRRSVLFLVFALVLAACGDGGDPSDRLADAFEETFDGTFAYEFTVDADSDALSGLGEGAGQAAAFLAGFSASGTVNDEDATFAITLLNQQIFQFRTIGQEAFYLQLGINDFIAAFGGGGFDPQDELVPALDALGLGEEVKGAVIEAFNGSWVGVEGELDTDELSALLGGEPAETDEESRERFREVFGEDIPAFFERFVVVESEESEDDVRQYDVLLQLHELLRAAAELNQELGVDDAGLGDLEADLADLPETVAGSVITADGLVEKISFDLADAVREQGDTEVAGSVELSLEITEHDDVPAVEAPEGATVLTAEQFADALAKLAELTTGNLGTPGG
ncbi:MAG: hypothetical protein R3320_00800 [Nitriliruptorales bacterium]|nr:hypothetical protein [Nitriliruptorales bacterium]